MAKVFVDNIWSPYNDDVNHLFNSEKYSFTKRVNDSNVIVQSNWNSPINALTKKKVMFCMEPWIPDHINHYDLVIITHKEIQNSNTYYYPFGIMTMYIYNHAPYILERPLKTINFSAKKFCVFINSNHKAWQRIDFCQRLLNHPSLPKVDCCGKSLTNCDICPYTHSSPEFINFLRQYKFIICFENSDKDGYFTEKIINAFVGDTVPIYWCNKNAQKYFNEKSMILLPEYTENHIQKVIDEIVTLQNNDELYAQKLREPLFKENQIPEEFKLDTIQTKVYSFLDKKYSFIIPYRNREENLKIFTERFSSFNLPDNYQFYFIHQYDDKLFNRGAMKNIGFLEASKINPDSLFVFHDIDTIPTYWGSILYDTKPGTVRRPVSEHYENLGTICCFYKPEFEKVNGFPNYWGWGLEDVTLIKRVQKENIFVDISNYAIFSTQRCQQLAHKRDQNEGFYLSENAKFYDEEMKTGINKDGLSTLSYTILSTQELCKNMKMINVKFLDI